MATYARHLTGDHPYALAMARSRDLMKHGGIVGAVAVGGVRGTSSPERCMRRPWDSVFPSLPSCDATVADALSSRSTGWPGSWTLIHGQLQRAIVSSNCCRTSIRAQCRHLVRLSLVWSQISTGFDREPWRSLGQTCSIVSSAVPVRPCFPAQSHPVYDAIVHGQLQLPFSQHDRRREV
jgi:hypothetical protein